MLNSTTNTYTLKREILTFANIGITEVILHTVGIMKKRSWNSFIKWQR